MKFNQRHQQKRIHVGVEEIANNHKVIPIKIGKLTMDEAIEYLVLIKLMNMICNLMNLGKEYMCQIKGQDNIQWHIIHNIH